MTDSAHTPAAHLERLTSLYERQAYTAWNVALRTAMADERAADAARRAFLAQVSAPDEKQVAFDAARFAAEAGAPVDPRGIDDPVLAAAARLAPAQRAVLALTALADASSQQVAGALGIEPGAEQELRVRTHEQLGALLGLSSAEAEHAYADLPWAEPPEELWAGLYPLLHGAVTQQARAQAHAQTQVAPAPARRRIGVGPLRRAPHAVLAAVAVLLVAAAALAATRGGGSGDDPGGPAGSAALPGDGGSSFSAATGESDSGTPSSPRLSPEELDRLRQEEIEELKRFTRRKGDKRLPPRERKRAARKVGDLVRLAQARQRAAERRELAIRQALAREREARVRERNRRREEARDSEPAREREPAPDRDEPAPQEPDSPEDRRDGRDDAEERRDQAEAECLYDAESGAYICPE